MLFAAMLILLNFVNTIGEYILDRYVTAAAHDRVAEAVAQQPGSTRRRCSRWSARTSASSRATTSPA